MQSPPAPSVELDYVRSADITGDNSNGRYISRDNGEEYKCKIEGQKMLERGKNDVPSTAPAPAAPPAAAPSVKP